MLYNKGMKLTRKQFAKIEHLMPKQRKNQRYQIMISYAQCYIIENGCKWRVLHIVTEWNTYTFLQTGAIGFAFAVIYLQSGNIILPMILHFVYDIIANLTVFIEWNNSNLFSYIYSVFEIMIAVMFVVSVIILSRKEATEDQTI